MDKYQQWNGPQSWYGQIWGIKIKWCQFERYDDPNLKDVILKGMTTEKLKKISFWRVWLPKMQFKLWNGPQSCLDKYQQWNGSESWYGQIL